MSLERYFQNKSFERAFGTLAIVNVVYLVLLLVDFRNASGLFVLLLIIDGLLLLYLFAGYAEVRQAIAAEDAKAETEKATYRRQTLEHLYRPFSEFARILGKLPAVDTIETPALRGMVAVYRDALQDIGLDPASERWRASLEAFTEATQAVDLQRINDTFERLFTLKEHRHSVENFLYDFEYKINIILVANAPHRLRLHAYGTPHREAERIHQSLTPVDYLITPDDRFKHAYIIGKTGAGKTTLLRNLITQDIARGDGVIVLSPERALFDFLLETCPVARADHLIIYDPTDNTPPVVSLNPIHLEDPHELATEAGAVAGTLARAMGDDLSGAMQTLLLKCAYTLLQLPNASFQDLRALLKPVSPLRDSLPTHPALDETTREYWRDEFDKGGHRRSAEALISRLDAFFMPPLCQTMSRASFAFTEALNASRSIFLFDLSRIRGTQEAIIGQLTLSHILQTLLKRDPQPENVRIPYHLYIDEFQLYAEKNESAFRDMLNRARKYKMSVTLAHQVTADIPTKLLDVILGNVGTKVCLQVAPSDADFFARQIRVKALDEPKTYGARFGMPDPKPPKPAEYLERLKVGEGFLCTPRHIDALKIAVPAEPFYYGDGLPTTEGYADRLRAHAKKNYGTAEGDPTPQQPPPAEKAHPAPDEDDDLFVN